MEIEELISALEETITLLRKSQPTGWAHMSVEEILQKLESEVAKVRNEQTYDSNLLSILFAPTGVIQETSIANAWENELLQIFQIIDRFTLSK